MLSLILSGSKGIAVCDELMSAEEKISVLEKELISPYCDAASEERNLELVLSIYTELFKKHKGVPNIEEIASEVDDYNWRITYNIAEIKYWEEGWHDPAVTPEQKHQLIMTLTNNYIDNGYFEVYGDTELYTMELLDSANACYTFSENHAMHESFFTSSDDVIIVSNDCQNTLLEDMLVKGQFYFKDVFEDIWRYRVMSEI